MTNGQPQVLPEGTTRNQGRNAQEVNIYVAQLVAGIVKTTLGPKGMDKLLVDGLGDVTVTNDGVTILREMTIENPVAKMMVNIAKTQESEVGDGTTTAVVLAGELLSNAGELIKKNIHPTVISKGYKMAADEAIRYLESIGVELADSDRATLVNIAKTAMTGKGAEDQRDLLAEIVVEAVMKVADGKEIDLEDIRIETKQGGSVRDTQIINGIVLDKKRSHPNMPKKVKDAKILLLDAGVEVGDLKLDAKINISNPAEMKAFMNSEAETIKAMIDKIIESGANVVIGSRAIVEVALHFLSKQGIFAIKRVPRDDLEKISRATGARIVTAIEDITAEDLGSAGEVEEKFIGDEDMTFIKECPHAKAVTILVRGSTEQMTSEVKRALEDAMGDIASMVRVSKAVGGAGGPEIMLSERLKAYASTQRGRIQLAINAFADAMEVIPETLAENAGLDPIDIVADLRTRAADQADQIKLQWPGIDVFSGKIIDAWSEGIIEPLKVKTQAVNSAAEVAIMILRIDDVIATPNVPGQPRE